MPPEWIDYNGHMMDAYYFLAFTEATEAFLDHVGLGAAYQARTGSGIYTAESHLCFCQRRDRGRGAEVPDPAARPRRQADARVPPDDQRRPPGGDLRADVPARQRRPGDADAARGGRAVAALAARHAALPRPGQAGRHVGIPGPASGLSPPGGLMAGRADGLAGQSGVGRAGAAGSAAAADADGGRTGPSGSLGTRLTTACDQSTGGSRIHRRGRRPCADGRDGGQATGDGGGGGRWTWWRGWTTLDAAVP